ncbi:MAG: SRPBCC domain-containing protein [Candidatus Kryptoniota bacterium]
MTTTDAHDNIITVKTILNCSIDTAFNYFADSKLLTKWLTQKADVELKEGGKYELS